MIFLLTKVSHQNDQTFNGALSPHIRVGGRVERGGRDGCLTLCLPGLKDLVIKVSLNSEWGKEF